MQTTLSSSTSAPGRQRGWFRQGRRTSVFGALWLLLLAGATGAWAQTPMSGAYTINDGQPTGGANFTSFTAAATALTTNGVSGPVTFTVSGGPYTEQLRLTAINGASATNRVTFNGGGRTIKFASSTSTSRAVVTLDGADYVTVNNLVIDATNGGAPGTYGWGVQLVNNADNNVISNNTITSSTSSTSSNFCGIVTSASTSAATTSGTASNQNVTITGNTITGGYYGITGIGVSTASPSAGLVISNNVVRDFYFYGIYVAYQTGPQIIGNELTRATAGISTSTFYGIYLTTSVDGADVEKNRLHQAFPAASTSTSAVYGIYISSSTGTATSPNDVVNNLVYDLNANGSVYAIYNPGGDFVRYYHNTVSIEDQSYTGSSSTYGFYQTTGLNVDFKNNVVRVARAGTGTNYAIYLTSTTGTTTSDYNNLSGSGNFVTGYYSGTSYATLANWRTANSGAFDQNSTDANPQFVNPASDLRPTAGALNGTGTPLTRVPQDITGATRGATPDMGAYEFTPPANDAAVVSIDSPVSPVGAGTRPVTVTILNNGATTLNTLRLEYVLNNGTPVVQNFTALNLASGATRSLTFTTQATLVVGANTVTVTASQPNGGTDANPGNNSQSTTVYTALSGTYTINKNAATGGSNFASFTEVATALNAAGIAGPVRFNVLNGPYTERMVLGVVPGTSATDTLVFDGGASKQAISFASSATSELGTIVLNGTDYVTLQNLTVQATGATYGIGIHLVGQANGNRVRGCVVTSSTTSTNSINAAFAASGSLTSASTSGDANNLLLENNVFTGGYYGLAVTGLSATTRATGLRIRNNEIRDFYYYGLNVEYTTGARLIGNNIHRTNRAGVSVFYGTYLTYNLGLLLENNRIHDSFTGNGGASTSTAYGIYFATSDATAGAENEVINNVVYNFNGAGVEYGIYNSGSDLARYYHNTVALDNAASTSGSASYGFYQVTSATGIDFRNNLISVTRGGSGSRFAMYFSTAASTITSDYNNLYIGSGTNYFTGYYGGNQATLAAWKAVNSSAYDQNSTQFDPIFRDPATGNLQPTSVQLNGTGAPALLTRVPRDIVGTTRQSPPDVGAYELTIVANDVAVISIDAPVTPAVLGSNPVRVTIRNGGTAVLNSVTLSYTVNNGATPATNSEVFNNLNLAAGQDRQLTFGTGITLTQIGTFTLTVTGSLPNGQPDGNAANNSQTVTFDQLTPPNDEPCAAVVLNGVVNSSNSASTTSQGGGLVNSTPTCSGALAPKDVWFLWTPTTATATLYTSGDAAGQIRVFTAANCSTSFSQVFCQASAGPGLNIGAVTVTGLTPNQRYYVAVSGFSSGDQTGPFTISTTALSTRTQTNAAALKVFPNPTATGSFTLKLDGLGGKTGTVELLNALGQTVRREALATAGEQQVSTRGLAAGLYTLRVQVGTDVMTRKVVLE
ncbi:T9SS type A sorting domain-containing protein [Hymenobacter gummosus]|uniref:T9SS type A sorting domain-containing protein n=1 Tax=Hymenobacter gummosus TaxID=1776032 RepID=A0A431TWB7_9BACT|nr:right-handed parallel beta-helix repeat-containing protein [Hymenobacter gummosus]RTQ45811.1 T9SS type A sorting domain-containing protein [Hymenobacter gummosus]